VPYRIVEDIVIPEPLTVTVEDNVIPKALTWVKRFRL
jgi:hypothetical protein